MPGRAVAKVLVKAFEYLQLGVSRGHQRLKKVTEDHCIRGRRDPLGDLRTAHRAACLHLKDRCQHHLIDQRQAQQSTVPLDADHQRRLGNVRQRGVEWRHAGLKTPYVEGNPQMLFCVGRNNLAPGRHQPTRNWGCTLSR